MAGAATPGREGTPGQRGTGAVLLGDLAAVGAQDPAGDRAFAAAYGAKFPKAAAKITDDEGSTVPPLVSRVWQTRSGARGCLQSAERVLPTSHRGPRSCVVLAPPCPSKRTSGGWEEPWIKSFITNCGPRGSANTALRPSRCFAPSVREMPTRLTGRATFSAAGS